MRGVVIPIVFLASAALAFLTWRNSQEIPLSVASFDECVEAGYTVTKTFPAECITPDGGRFIRNVVKDGPSEDIKPELESISESKPEGTSVKPKPSPTKTENIPAGDTLLKIILEGGLCPNPDGEGGALCHQEVMIFSEGEYTYQRQDGLTKNGNFSTKDVAELKKLIAEADFPAIMSKEFKGLCPTAYDGAEATYTFYSRGSFVIPSCTYEIGGDLPLFVFIHNQLFPQIYSDS